MTHAKYLVIAASFFLCSCASMKKAGTIETLPDADQQVAMVGVFSTPKHAELETPTVDETPLTSTAEISMAESPKEESATNVVATTKLKAKSFAELKQMATSGQITMGKRDLKTLDRLNKHYKGDFKDATAAFEMSTPAWIIAGIGVTALLIALLAGSFFFGFVFVLAVAAFVLRWADVIQF